MRDKTNAQLNADYGLAIAGSVAPSDGEVDPQINAILGSPATYLSRVDLMSPKYTRDLASYRLEYTRIDPQTSLPVLISESEPTQLKAGWNLLTRTIDGQPRTLLVYGDITVPTFQFNPGLPRALNEADLRNGSTLVIDSYVWDDSSGPLRFAALVKLNDPNQVSAIRTRVNGTRYVTLSFSISDFAGNSSRIAFNLDVSSTARLIKDLNSQNMPLFDPLA